MNNKFVLFTHSTAEVGGGLELYNYKRIGYFSEYSDALEKAIEIGCNADHIGYEFSVFKTTYEELLK